MPAADAPTRARTFDVVIAVWGQEFRRLFLDVCVPNQLTPGNLGALPAGSRYRLFTSPDDVAVFKSSSVLRRVSEQVPVDVVVMPELSASSRSRFGRMTACHRRALIDARESRSALIFLCADHVISEGTFAAAVRRHDAGSRAVMCTGIRVNREAIIAALLARGDVRALPPRELVSVALEQLHPFTRAHMIDSERSARRPISVYWNVPGEGILARCFHLHPLMVDPVRRDVMPEDTIDGHYVRRSCPVREDIHVVVDSDELAIFEMSHVDDAVADTGPGGVSTWRASTMISRCDSHQQSYWTEPIRLHVRDIGDAWSPVERHSARFANQAMQLWVARRWLRFRYLKVRWRHATKPLVARRLRRSVVLLTHAATRRVQKLRKRAARAGRRVLVR